MSVGAQQVCLICYKVFVGKNYGTRKFPVCEECDRILRKIDDEPEDQE